MPIALRRAFVVLTAAWAVALLLATFAAGRPHAGSALYAFALVVYGFGSQACHQLPERSFHLWGANMPVCARCAGIYFAGAMAAVVSSMRIRPKAVDSLSAGRAALVLSVVPTAATLAYEWTTGSAPANWIRALAGAPIGAVVSWIVVTAGRDGAAPTMR